MIEDIIIGESTDLESRCHNKPASETEKKIWRETAIPYNTEAINTFMRTGCYTCRGYDKRCEYYSI